MVVYDKLAVFRALHDGLSIRVFASRHHKNRGKPAAIVRSTDDPTSASVAEIVILKRH